MKINTLSLERQLRMYQAKEAIVNRISPEVCDVIDLAAFLQATANEVGKMMEVSRCHLILCTPGRNPRVDYEYLGEEGLPSSLGKTIPLEGLFLRGGKVVNRSPISINDTSRSTLEPGLRSELEGLRSRSTLIVPIIFQEALLGIIGLHFSSHPHQWTPYEISIIKSLAQQVAIGFQYTKIYTEKEREAENLKIMLEIANGINSKVDFDEITTFVIDKSIELLKAEIGCIGVLDSSERYLHFHSFRSSSPEYLEGIDRTGTISTTNPMVHQLIHSRRSIPLANPEEDEYASYYLGRLFRGRAALISPIFIGERFFGTINLIWLRERIPFSPYEVELIEGIANQAATVLERDWLSTEVLRLQRELKGVKASEMIIGNSRRLKRCVDLALQVAESSTTVLVEGESGTGKELIADLVHQHSPRHHKPYLKINCGAIPETLLETELFGYEKGAFTDAKSRKIGKFEEANGGTIFLDEVSELSPAAQVKLLRVLQSGEFTRVGGNQKITADVRVIAATNAPLEEDMEKGLFRRDLYYRLNVFPIKLPSLRERKEDIPLLVSHFLNFYKKKANKYLVGISEKALRLLKSYSWPGNVRELENVVERAVIMATKKVVTVDDLPEHLLSAAEESREKTLEVDIGTSVEEMERRLILETLNYTGGDKNQTARILGISRKTLYRKLKKYGYLNSIG